MKRRGLVAAVMLAGVVVAGWWWQRDRAPLAPPAAPTSPDGAPEITRGSAPARDGELASEARAMIDDDPVGALRLEGQVVDGDGRGVPNATVRLSANPPRTVQTEDDGSFAFDGLISRPYTLIARAAKGVAGPITTRLGATSEPVLLRLRPASVLTVSVVRRDGEPAEGAIVEIRGSDEQRAVVSGGAAVFSPILPGGYQLVAWAAGSARAFQWLQVGEGNTTARVVLVAGAPVSGRVVDELGNGIAHAQVRYRGASDWTVQADDRRDGVMTAADGSFRFDALPAGSVRLVAVHPDRAPGTSPLITLDGRTPRDGITIAMAAGAIVRGRVVDGQNRPVGSARIRVTAAGESLMMAFEPPRQTYSDAQGAFEITGLARRKLLAVARHELGASPAIAVDTTAGTADPVTLTLSITGTISGIVVDSQGQPIEGAQVSAYATGGAQPDAGAASRELATERSDAQGRFTLSGLATGSYRVWAVPASRGPGRGELRGSVIATTGATDVRLVIAPDGGVRGRVLFADGSAPELFRAVVGRSKQTFAAGDGELMLEGLVPAAQRLEVSGPGFVARTIEITVEPSALVDIGTITVVRGRSIAGTVIANGQPVAGATVYAGRMVYGSGTNSDSARAMAPPISALDTSAKTVTTDASGAFSMSGFSGGDVTLVAEHEDRGRSRAIRLPEVMPGQTELTIALEPFGALHGVVRQGQPSGESLLVTCQSASTPGAIYRVVAGADGSFRFDRLAPDVYKVSVVLRAARFGARFYSRQATVVSGQDVTADLALDPGPLTLDVAIAEGGSKRIGAASIWLASGAITAKTMTELTLVLAAGVGTSVRLGVAAGENKQFTQLSPGLYTVCVTPMPREVTGGEMADYLVRNSDVLPAFCNTIELLPSPELQTARIAVEIPAYQPQLAHL